MAQTAVGSFHLKLAGDQLCACWSPDGKKLVFQSNEKGNWDIFLYELVTGHLRRLTSTVADEQHPVWVPGKQAVIFDRGSGKHTVLCFKNLPDGKIRKLIPRDVVARQASVTPSGHLVAFSGWDKLSNSWQVFTYDFIYNNLNQLTHTKGTVTFPVFDSGGKVIYYLLKEPNGLSGLHAVNWFGAPETIRPEIMPGRISWKADGWWFYGIRHLPGEPYQICRWFKDGTNRSIVRKNQNVSCYPSVSPDGKHIAYSQEADDGFDIFIIPNTNQ